jgi:probable F420-dependent oxidoreductase
LTLANLAHALDRPTADRAAYDAGVGPIRFSIQIPHAPSQAHWADLVHRAEDAGFYSVSVPDHLGPSLPQLAPVAALAAAAAVSSRIRLAITVLNNDFRHPVLVAKELATLDLLSNGRVDMGLGAGWLPEDYTSTGIAAWDPAGVRVGRLEESMTLLRQLLTGDSVTFHGRHYHVEEFASFPRPVQQPIPLMIGAGAKRMLTLAAQRAQIISIITRLDGNADTRRDAFERQLGWIRDAGGFERKDLQVGVRVLFGQVGDGDRRALAESLGAARGMDADEVLSSPFGLVGDLTAIKDHLRSVSERYGVSYFTVSEDLAWQIAPVVAELASAQDGIRTP